MKAMSRLSRSSMMTVLVFGVFLALTANPQVASAEISVDSYCQLTIQSMQQEISNFQQLIALANQYKDDPETLERHIEIKRLQFDQAKNTLYSSFDTTDNEYVTYMGRNGHAVDAYLVVNPDIKEQIDGLSVQVNSLMEEYESLKGSSEPPVPPLP